MFDFAIEKAADAGDHLRGQIALQGGGVARVTLDRPEIRNAFDDALIAELTGVLKQLDADRAVRAVVLAWVPS